MSTTVVRSNAFAQSVFLCAWGATLLCMSGTAAAASKTLTISGIPPATVAVNAHYSYTPGAKDTVRSRIKFDIYNKPSWASFDATTGRLYGFLFCFFFGSFWFITIRLTDWYG